MTRELQMIIDGLERARGKFPKYPIDVIHAAAIVGEETGELLQAAIQRTYEGGTREKLIREAVHSGAMALEFLLMIDDLVARPSPQVPRCKEIPNAE